MMTDEEKAAEILRSSAIFATGCGNTVIDDRPPEVCEECRTYFLERIARILSGELSPAEIAS